MWNQGSDNFTGIFPELSPFLLVLVEFLATLGQQLSPPERQMLTRTVSAMWTVQPATAFNGGKTSALA